MNIVPDLPEQIKSGKRAFSRRKQYLNGSHYTQFPRVGTPKWLLFAKVLYRKLQATLLYLGPNVWKFAWIFLKPVKSLVVSKFIMKRQQALYQQWIMQNEPAIKELNLQQNHQFKIQPSISIVVPVFNAPPDFLVELFESVLNQTYSKWELCMADGHSTDKTKNVLQKYAGLDERIKVKFLDSNKGIAGNSNEALRLATGDFIALLDHDDTIPPFSLFEIVKAINENPDVEFIYTDEDKITSGGKRRYDPQFKPDYNLDLLRSCNYITHFSVVRKTLLDKVGGFSEELDGSQDYDLILRLTEKTSKIIHIPKILYHWRAHGLSVASGPVKLFAYEAGKTALKHHLNRCGLDGTVENALVLGRYKITFDIKTHSKISIVIPNKNYAAVLDRCVRSIFKSTYKNYEIVIVENGSTEQDTFDVYKKLAANPNVKIVEWKGKFNWSAVNNFGAQNANGEILLFLNNDVEIINGDWLERMLEQIQRADVGVVGAKLYYPNDTVQHAGVILGIGGIASHAHKFFARAEYGYFGRLIVVQDLTAVTGACLMTKRQVYEETGKFDEEYELAFGDVDYCLKVRKNGYLVVWTPYSELYHYESMTRGDDDTPEKQARFKGEIERFKKKWLDILMKGDEYYNPNLTLVAEDFGLKVFEDDPRKAI